VVVHVDSGGGSALASDAIWRELKLLDEEKPVIVYMGDVAASGGYYIAAPGRKIVAQNATLTGSIGVITAKPVTAGALDKIHAHRESVQRGDNAAIYADDTMWNEEQRRLMDGQIQYVYRRFKTVVAHGRKLGYDDLDDICNGRVWTGKQALAHGLVDAVGDFQVALDLACVAAGLPTDGSVQTAAISAPRRHLLAEPAEAALGVTRARTIRRLAAAVVTGEWEALFGHEHCWLIADGLPRI
jgi:protease IV